MTALPVSDVKARLAEIQLTIAGIKRAYVNAPASLPHADLPLFVNLIGAATYTPLGETLYEETRAYIMRMYVKPFAQGIDGEAEAAVEPYLTAARDVFLSHPHLGNGTAGNTLDWVTGVQYQGDFGIAILPFANEQFLGAEFRLNVTQAIMRQIAKFE